MSSNISDDDLSWPVTPATAASGGKPRVESAFKEPILVTDVDSTDRDIDNANDGAEGGDGNEDHPDVGGYAPGDENGQTAAKKVNPKPNIAILALVAVLGLGVLGGVGWFINKQVSKPASYKKQEIALAPSSGGINPGNAGFPLDGGKTETPVNVFESGPAGTAFPVPAATTVIPVATSVASTVTAAAVIVTAPAPAAIVARVVIAPVVVASAPKPSPKVVADAAVVSESPYTPASETPKGSTSELEKSVAAAKAVVAAAPMQKPAKAQPVKNIRHNKVRKPATTAPVAVAAAEPAATKPVRRVRGAKVKGIKQVVTAKAAVPTEEFVLPGGMKVRSIYPSSGPDSQAWISDSNGKVEVVHVGDTLRGGARVISIVGAKGHVLTSSGLLTTNGVTK